MSFITIGFISFIAIIILIIVRFFINKINVKIEANGNFNMNRLAVKKVNNVTSASVRNYHTSISTNNNHRPLPVRHNKISVFMYPKCRVCRCKNFQGMNQKVFYSESKKCYYCENGHYFTG